MLKKILEKESQGWYIKFKDRLVAEMEGEGHMLFVSNSLIWSC